MRRLLSAESIAPAVAVVAFFAVVGWLSARRLEQTPEFDERAEMLWGARRFWLMLAAALAVPYATIYLVAARTPWFMVGMIGSVALLQVAFLTALRVTAGRRGDGAVLSAVALGERLRGTQFDIQEYLRRTDRRIRRNRIVWAVVDVTHVAIVLFWAYVLLSVAYPLDRYLIASTAAEAIGMAVQVQLPSELVREVAAYAPTGGMDRIPGLGGRRDAVESVRSLLGLAPENAPPRTTRDRYHLYVKLREGTTPAQTDGVADAVVEALRAVGEQRHWFVVAHGGGEGPPARRLYP